MNNEQRKNKVRSVSALCLAALAVFCLVCTCAPPTDGDEEDASVTITIGGGSRAALTLGEQTIDTAQLDHTITLTNDSGENVEKTGVKAGQTVQFTVTPGHWNISVKAYYNGRLMAEGTASVNLKRGRNPSVPITMTQVESKKPDDIVPDPDAIPIEIVNIVITGPVKDDTPPTQVDEGEGNFIVSGITWEPSHNPFQGGMAYTASVTLTANSGHTFTGLSSAKINGHDAVVTNNTGTTVTLSHTFAETSTKTVTSITIKSSPSNMSYTHGETLDLSGLVVTLVYEDSTTDDVTPEDFEANGLTAIPSNGDELIFSEHNGKPVTIKHGQHLMQETTAKLTVSKADPVTDDFIFSGVETATYDGNQKSVHITPRNGKSNGTRKIYYEGTGETTYTKSETAPTNAGTYDVTFDIAEDTNYTAKSGLIVWTLTINPAPITIFAITGIAAPVDGETPATAITATTQYSGTVSWNPSDITFKGGTEYTATIHIEPYANYTMTGVAENSFSVTGATTYIAGSDTVKAVFPKAAFTSIASFATWLGEQSGNDAATAYDVKLNVSELVGTAATSGSLGYVLKQNNAKYVYLDLSGSTIENIPNNTFFTVPPPSGCTTLVGIILPDSVTSIGSSAFTNCTSLTSVTLLNNAEFTTIGSSAFSGCTSLASITIPDIRKTARFT
ncbi:leucine-rich repeat protein [Treponema sp. R80B11-R83G3]